MCSESNNQTDRQT